MVERTQETFEKSFTGEKMNDEEFAKLYLELVSKVKKVKYIRELNVLFDEWKENIQQMNKLFEANEEIHNRIVEIIKYAMMGDTNGKNSKSKI